jgi:hypothetical protein
VMAGAHHRLGRRLNPTAGPTVGDAQVGRDRSRPRARAARGIASLIVALGAAASGGGGNQFSVTLSRLNRPG